MTGVWNGEQLVSNKTELQTRLIQHIVKDRIHKGTAATDLINNLTTTYVSTCPLVKYNNKFSMGRDRLIVTILCVCVCVCGMCLCFCGCLFVIFSYSSVEHINTFLPI